MLAACLLLWHFLGHWCRTSKQQVKTHFLVWMLYQMWFKGVGLLIGCSLCKEIFCQLNEWGKVLLISTIKSCANKTIVFLFFSFACNWVFFAKLIFTTFSELRENSLAKCKLPFKLNSLFALVNQPHIFHLFHWINMTARQPAFSETWSATTAYTRLRCGLPLKAHINMVLEQQNFTSCTIHSYGGNCSL